MKSHLNLKRAEHLISKYSKEIAPAEIVADPLVSVCIITYDHKPFIEETLDGVLMQKTDFSIEILIGDDASSDGSSDIIDRYQKAHPDKIRILRSTENLFKYAGNPRLVQIRNFRASRGEYIALLDGDDYWTDPLKLQKQVDFLAGNPDFTMCFHNRRLLCLGDPDRDGERLPEGMLRELTHEEICMNRFWTPPTATLMLLKSAIMPLPEWFLDIPVGDRAMAIMATQKGRCGYCADIGDSVYRLHQGGMHAGAGEAKRALMDMNSRKIVLKHVPMSANARRFHANRIYDLYVRVKCHDTDLSLWGRLALRTSALCHSIAHWRELDAPSFSLVSRNYSKIRIFLGRVKRLLFNSVR